MQAALPDMLRHNFDWTTLILVDGTFVDEDLQGSQSELLYQIEHTESGRKYHLGDSLRGNGRPQVTRALI